MSHPHAPQLEKHGAGHAAAAPQVAVRDGDRLLCPCCGEVLMHLSTEDPPVETPAVETRPMETQPAETFDWPPVPSRLPTFWDVIAQRQDAEKDAAWEAYLAAEEAEKKARHAQFLASDDPRFCADYLTQPIDPEVAAYAFPEEDPPQLPSNKRSRSSSSSRPKPRGKCDGAWRDVCLEEPHGYQQRRYLAWSYYHLKLEDLKLQEKIHTKQAKIDWLRKELGGEHAPLPYEACLPDADAPKVRPPVEVIDFDLRYWIEKVRAEKPPGEEPRRVAYLGQRLVPPSYSQERGPP